MVLSLLVVMLIQHGDQFELQWDIQSLLALNMLLLGMKIVGKNTTKVFNLCLPNEDKGAFDHIPN